MPQINSLDITPAQLIETLEILQHMEYIKIRYSSGRGDGPYDFDILPSGFEAFARRYVENYPDVVRNVASQIVNMNEINKFSTLENLNIVKSLKQPKIIIDHILGLLESENYITTSHATGSCIMILNVSPVLKRKLQNDEILR